MAPKRRPTRPILLLALAALLLPAASLRAEDWDDQRRDRLEEAVRALERAREVRETGRTPDGGLLGLRHGEVALVADLARVEVTLEVRNDGATPLEWQRSFRLDPNAEAIGATLRRQDDPPIPAQTLTLADARRLYGEVRTPQPTRARPRIGPWNQGYGRDPLRLERPSRDRLDVAVWPVAPGETVRVGLTFVSPLAGRGGHRTWVDPVQGLWDDEAGATPDRQAVATAPDRPSAPAISLALDTDWVVDTGGLEVRGAPTGMAAAGEAGGRLRFVGATRPGRDDAPTLPLRVPEPRRHAVSVPGGGLGTHVAVFHFDPLAFAADHDLEGLPRDATLRLLRVRGNSSRIAPFAFALTSDPLPVTARLHGGQDTLRFDVEVVASDGSVLATVPVTMPAEPLRGQPEQEGAITGWHRAALARRVLDWAGTSDLRRERALDFAVDLGVLLEGTGALAVPREDLRDLRRSSRRTYDQQGAPLGAQGREADFRTPPPGSVSR